MNSLLTYDSCSLCPRNCHINRHLSTGYCDCGDTIKAARAALHQWEEPCISGLQGSGTVFFTGCTLRCCFCQNYTISQENLGKDPLRFVQDAFSPSLAQVQQPAQISIFDLFDEKNSEAKHPAFDLDIQILSSELTEITYSIFPYFLGTVFIASNEFGICQLTFEDTDAGLTRLKKTFPKDEL